ncbi:hypothetical protein MMPV_001286 [Pyropia vietnamensis]
MNPTDDYPEGNEDAGRERRPRGPPVDRRSRASGGGGERSARSHGRGGGGGTEDLRKSRHGPRSGQRGAPASAVADDTEGAPGSSGRRLRSSHGRHVEHRGGLLPLPAATTTTGSLWLTGNAKRGGRLPWSNILRVASALALLYLLLFQLRTLKEQPTFVGANRPEGGRSTVTRPSVREEASRHVHVDRPATRGLSADTGTDGADGGGDRRDQSSRDFHPSMPATYSDLFNPGGAKQAPSGSGPTVAKDATPPVLNAATSQGEPGGGAASAAGEVAPAGKVAESASVADETGGAGGTKAGKGGEETDKGTSTSDGASMAAAATAGPAAPPAGAAGGSGASSETVSGGTGGDGSPSAVKEPTKEDFLAAVARKKKKAAAAAAEAAAAAKAASPRASKGSLGMASGSGSGSRDRGDGGGGRDGSSGRGSDGAEGGGGGGGGHDRPHPPSGTHNGSTPGQDENFWKWFQQTKGAEHKDASKAVECPEDNHRLCETLYKYLRKYKIRTVLDASCGANTDWMPTVLKQVGSELWGFRYYCMNTGPEAEEGTERAKGALSAFPFVEFVPSEWWVGGFPDGLDLVFAWDVLPHTAYGRVWSFFMLARKHAVRYLLFDNYPGLLNNPSPKRKFINVRKHPFKFPAAKEVVQNVTEPGEHIKRQLLFYETESLPEHLTT